MRCWPKKKPKPKRRVTSCGQPFGPCAQAVDRGCTTLRVAHALPHRLHTLCPRPLRGLQRPRERWPRRRLQVGERFCPQNFETLLLEARPATAQPSGVPSPPCLVHGTYAQSLCKRLRTRQQRDPPPAGRPQSGELRRPPQLRDNGSCRRGLRCNGTANRVKQDH